MNGVGLKGESSLLADVLAERDVGILELKLTAILEQRARAGEDVGTILLKAGFVERELSSPCRLFINESNTGGILIFDRFISARLCGTGVEVQASYRSV